MNIVLLLDNDFFFLPDCLDRFLERVSRSRHSVLAGIVTSPVPSPGWRERWGSFTRKFVFVGGAAGLLKVGGRFLRKWFRSRRFGRRTYFSIPQVCRAHGIPFFVTDNVNQKAACRQMADHRPQLLISLQSQILKPATLQIPSIGCINKHAGLLPHYRGIWPVFWALLRGESECGVTLHWMNEAIDDGDILLQERIGVAPEDSVFDVYEKIFDRLPALLEQALELAVLPFPPRLPNDREAATGYTFPTRSDVRELKRLRGRVVL